MYDVITAKIIVAIVSFLTHELLGQVYLEYVHRGKPFYLYERLKSLNVPFLALYPAFTRFFNDFFPRACFFLETMRPLRVFMRSFLTKPPDVCFAEPCHTCAFVPTAGTLRVVRAPPFKDPPKASFRSISTCVREKLY